jgi:hypothetical protein
MALGLQKGTVAFPIAGITVDGPYPTQSSSQSINQSSSQSINQSINQSIKQSINQSINQSNNQHFQVPAPGGPEVNTFKYQHF